MAARITAMVNEVLSEEEPGTKQLSEADVLGLIDTGGSEGGSQVCPFGPCHAMPLPCIEEVFPTKGKASKLQGHTELAGLSSPEGAHEHQSIPRSASHFGSNDE
jgi:hypothetical protein